MQYDIYNREERAACAHAFRLLHEDLVNAPDSCPLAQVLKSLAPERQPLRAAGAVILTEVALVRDAYHQRRADPAELMDALVEFLAQGEQVRPWSRLPSPLNDPKRTHPRQIAQKGRDAGILEGAEEGVYADLQAMFNAKPDLAFVLPGSCIITFEAKLTQRFDQAQLARTRQIAEVWSRLLFKDLGFDAPPPFAVATLGLASTQPDLTWQKLAELAAVTYPPGDRTRIALDAAAKLQV